MKADETVAQRTILTTVALLDFTSIRGIGNTLLPGSSSYHRQFGIQELPKGFMSGDTRMDVDLGLHYVAVKHFVDPAGRAHANEKINKNQNYIHVESFQDARVLLQTGNNEIIHIQTPVTLQQLKELDDIFLQNGSEYIREYSTKLKSHIIATIEIDDITAGVFVLGKRGNKDDKENILVYENKDIEGLKDMVPRSELARADVWISSLNIGEPVLLHPYENSAKPTVAYVQPVHAKEEVLAALTHFSTDHADIIANEPPHMRRLWRRDVLGIESGYDQKILESWAERTQIHLRENFGNSEATVMLTKSGVSANESVISALVNTLGSQTPIHILGNNKAWYYENDTSVRENFPTIIPADQAQILFINWEPMYPDMPLTGNPSYVEQRNQAITSLYERARQAELQASDQQFVLVVDKTTNLLLLPEKNRPKNLTILETASFTKHQEGGRNYFSGAIFGYGNHTIIDAVAQQIVTRGVHPSPSVIINFPRPTRSHIEAQVQDLHARGEFLAQQFDLAQQHLPSSLRVAFQPWSYYGFVVFPNKELTRLYLAAVGKNDLEDTTGLSYGQKYYSFFTDYMESKYWWNIRLKESAAPKIPAYDTFNLDHLSFLRIGNGEYPLEITTGVTTVRDSILRYSYGTGDRDTTISQMKELAQFFGQGHTERMEILYEPYIPNQDMVSHNLIDEAGK